MKIVTTSPGLPYICLSRAVNQLHVTILARSSRGMCKLFVSNESTSAHEFASQFGLEIVFIREKHPTTTANTESHARATVHLNDPATPVSAVMVERHRPVRPATTAPGGALRHKSHRCPRPIKSATLFLHGLKSVVQVLLRSPIKNWFVMLSRFVLVLHMFRFGA